MYSKPTAIPLRICLRHLAQWYLPPEPAPPWFTAEAHYCPHHPLAAYLFATLTPAAQGHPVVSCLRGSGGKPEKNLNIDPFLITSSSIWYNPSLRFGKSSFYSKEWAKNGIRTLGNLFEGHNLKSFSNLQVEFHLQKHNHWRYMQMHCLLKNIFMPPMAPTSAEVPLLIIARYGMGHEASLYYSMLLWKYATMSSLKKIWERDLEIMFTDEEWTDIFCNLKKMACDFSTRLI